MEIFSKLMTPLNVIPDATGRHDAAGDGDAARRHDGHDAPAAGAAGRRRARRRGEHGRPGSQHGRPARRSYANDGVVRGEHAGPRGLGGAAGTLFSI